VYLFQNALLADPQNISMLVLFMAAGVWFVMAVVLLVDLFSDATLSLSWKVIWCPVLICVPLFAGLFYSVFSIIRALLVVRKP
jgi:hypothetical protein